MDQDSTVQNRTPDKAIIPAWYFDAFALKMMGLQSTVIAEKVKKTPAHVRSLFAKSGPMYEYWRKYVEQEKSGVIEEALDMFFAHLPDTARMTIMRAKEGRGMVGIEAARDIFSYTLGKPEERIKLDAKVGVFNFSDWALAQSESIKQKDAARKSRTESAGTPAAEIPPAP